MSFSPMRTSLICGAAACWLAGTALAQGSANYTSVEAVWDRPVQLSYHASAHGANCTAASLPTVRVTQPPKWGILTVRRAILTTDKVKGCPSIKTPAQVVFYQARSGYTGADHANYEVTSENGEIATYDITIVVKGPPEQGKPSETGAQPL